ncbi:putative type VI secretion system effector [Acinetobacter bereziniae]|uniref:putative type VI secretion system effector n=1 Tax=Acinetobacter bereziniae TaxID=106648 RepID=UPI0037BF55C8
MTKMLVIEGIINNLKVEDSKIHPLKNLDKDALGASMLGTLTASSLLTTNAPIMLMATQGISAKTFTAEINGYPIIGQFTTVKFKEDTPLVAVISTEKEKGRYLVYSILDPQSGLLYMMYEMGRSVSKGKLAIFKQALYFSFFGILFIIIFTMGYVYFSQRDFVISDISDVNLFVYIFVLSFILLFFIMNLALSKPYKIAGELSEQVFEKLKFEKVKQQDFYHDFDVEDGVHLSVMEYRKSLKGKDPYPEDYFKKKNNQNDGD